MFRLSVLSQSSHTARPYKETATSAETSINTHLSIRRQNQGKLGYPEVLRLLTFSGNKLCLEQVALLLRVLLAFLTEDSKDPGPPVCLLQMSNSTIDSG
jgi:hypothetical protein